MAKRTASAARELPAAGDLFFVGQTIPLRATATDAEDGTLVDAALTWTVLEHHDVHTHPFFGPTQGNAHELDQS